ncbi:MAG: hypothetical protein ACREOA_05750 [Candidatus Dormibacteria bacterium]
MNVWECQSCGTKVEGLGGAVGLRAIGWYFEPGPVIYCPRHRPDGTLERGPNHDPGVGGPCALCTAELEATRLQTIVEAAS